MFAPPITNMNLLRWFENLNNIILLFIEIYFSFLKNISFMFSIYFFKIENGVVCFLTQELHYLKVIFFFNLEKVKKSF